MTTFQDVLAQAMPTGGPAQLAARYAGGTRQLAEQLGVSQRTVQRWTKFEQGGGGEARNVQRSPQRGPVQQMAEAQRQREALRVLREQGVTLEGGTAELIYGRGDRRDEDHGQRDLREYQPMDLAAALNAFESGDSLDVVEDAFQAAILDAYGAGSLPPDFFSLTDINATFSIGR